MTFVAICDDEKKIGAQLEGILIDIFTKLNIKYEIDVYFAGDELYRKIEAGAYYDLVFLDIEFSMDKINGVEVGRLIRDTLQNNMLAIVYISWEMNYAMQLFHIRPLNFLVKPLDYERVEAVIRMYLKLAGLWSEKFTYKIGHDFSTVQIKDIIYLKSHDRKLILHLTDGRKEEFYGSLKEAYEQQLKKFDFLFIHASYVVNFDYVVAIKYNQLFLTDSLTPLPISPHRRTEVRERYYAIMKRRRMS